MKSIQVVTCKFDLQKMDKDIYAKNKMKWIDRQINI